MEYFFLGIYSYLKTHRVFFYLSFSILMILFSIGAWQIHIEEDITKFFPNDKKVAVINQVFGNSKFMDKLVVMVSLKDSSAQVQPDSLIVYTDELVGKMETELKPYIKNIMFKVDDEVALEMFNTIYEYLPVFISDNDYASIDSLITPAAIRTTLERNYQQLISPAGLVMKKIIMKDPVGISGGALRKIRDIQYDDNFELYDNYILTKDRRHLVLFVSLANPSYETKSNRKFLDSLGAMVNGLSGKYPNVKATYFGGTAVAVGNARQLTSDTILTVTIMLFLLIVFLVWFFRRKRAPLIILIPVLFGGLFSLFCIWLIKGSVSVIAMATGSVVMGIAVNYSLHFLAHLRHTGSITATIRDLSRPMTIGSTTTILAFFCLQFTHAEVLRDLGLFAGFCLIGAALCSLIFLPQMIRSNLFMKSSGHEGWLDRFSIDSPRWNKYIVAAIFILTPVLFYYARDVRFNSDMMSLNFMNEDLRKAEAELNRISDFSLQSVYIVSSGATVEEALRNNEKISSRIDELKHAGLVKESFSVSSFILSDSLQQERIKQWNDYWTPEKKERLRAILREEGSKLKFSPVAFLPFDSMLEKRYATADKSVFNTIRSAFFDDYITEKPGMATVVTLAKADPDKRTEVLSQLNQGGEIKAIDRQMLTSIFVEDVNADFTFIVTFTSVLVFVVLLISYGRIELTLITFLPMLIAWIWILGIMSLAGIEFNIVNVMVSTFIFGLGDDYSIFIMDGLQQEYKLGRKNLSSYKTAILLSALTTIAGLGVLIFAQHPALKSIAAISIIGIVCVFFISQTLEPFLFSLFITGRTKRGLTPATLRGLLISGFGFGFFLVGAIILTIVGIVLLKLIPFWRKQMRLAYHFLLSKFTGALVYMMANVKKRILNKDKSLYSEPKVVISNHQSFIDILVTTMMHPKIILLTNKWVWNSPVFGLAVRLADYYPVMDGVEGSLDRLSKRVEEGYSIMVFPEGTRSTNGKINRFRRGAFFIAEKLKLDILPLLIHGIGHSMRKGEFYLNDSTITMKFLPPISQEDTTFGDNYTERTKKISSYFRKEFKALADEIETPAYYRHQLINNYLYKGPILEWYLRIKLKLERNYEPIEKLIPHEASILDLGCGYGFLCYMLHFLSEERMITGVDYDMDKIETAGHCYSKSDRLQFIYADITTYSLPASDVIILSDVLHYLSHEQQVMMIEKCIANLNPGGQLIVREGNADLSERHRGTRFSEFLSVKIFRFNKSVRELNFMSGETIRQLGEKSGMKVEVIDDSKYTSNLIFVLKKTVKMYAST